MHRYCPKPHRLAGGESGIEAVEDPHLVSALVFAVQIQGNRCAIAPTKLTAPSRSWPGFQGRGHDVGGHQGAGVKQQAELVESHNGVLSLQIWVLSR